MGGRLSRERSGSLHLRLGLIEVPLKQRNKGQGVDSDVAPLLLNYTSHIHQWGN